MKRTIKDKIYDKVKARPVVYISGARQIGKSTLCKEIMKDLGFNYVTLDNIRDKELAVNAPEMFLKIYKWPLIIDEVQYAPELFDVIQSIVNKENFDNGNNYSMFVLTKIECKPSVAYKASDVKSFKQLDCSVYKLGPSCIICNTDKIYKIDDNIIALPISSI